MEKYVLLARAGDCLDWYHEEGSVFKTVTAAKKSIADWDNENWSEFAIAEIKEIGRSEEIVWTPVK